MIPTVNVLGIHIHNYSRAELFQALDGGGAVFTPNVDFIIKMRRNRAFWQAFHAAEFRICDSQLVLLASRLLGTPLKEKIAGSDFLGEFCLHHAKSPDTRIFLLGAMPGVAREAMRRINARIGRDIVVGAHSPSYGFEKNEEECAAILEVIRASAANVLTVGLGAPKQEFFINRYRDQLPGVKLFFALGATLDFEAGNVQRAPKWMQTSGLEWAYRLLSEPRRLWRRYLIEDPPFFWFLLLQKLGLDKFSKQTALPEPRA